MHPYPFDEPAGEAGLATFLATIKDPAIFAALIQALCDRWRNQFESMGKDELVDWAVEQMALSEGYDRYTEPAQLAPNLAGNFTWGDIYEVIDGDQTAV